MNTHTTTIGIDLAKHSFHVYELTYHNKVIIDKKLSRRQMHAFLCKHAPAEVVMEACGSANYWAQIAMENGHTATLLAPKVVTPFRQGHKTDRNDALAIAVASRRPKVKTVAIKSKEQQSMQAIDRIRQHHVDNLTKTSNMIRGLLYEFGEVIRKGHKALRSAIPQLLENSDNILPLEFKQELAYLWESYCLEYEQTEALTQRYNRMVKRQEQCSRLMELEGVGPIGALKLFLALGHCGQSFKNGREAAACIGVTPTQYSTGGVVQLGGISKQAGNKRLRATLIQGALAVIKVLCKKPLVTAKLQWLYDLAVRRGVRRAAVALVNKNIRTAWAMLRNGSRYRPELLPLSE